MPEHLSHPAACPYCKGTLLNQAQPDCLLRPVRLNADGSMTIGDPIGGSDFKGPSMLFCHGCNSTFVQPGDVTEHHDDSLEVDYPEAPPEPGEPGYRGMGVAWVATPSDDGAPLTMAVAGRG